MTKKDNKLRATDNLAKDVETPKMKLKRIDISDNAKASISGMTADLNKFIAGLVAGMGIEGRWSFDMRKMQIIVEDK